MPARVLLDTVIGIFRYPTSAVPAENSRSDLEMELKSIQWGSACPTFYVTTESGKRCLSSTEIAVFITEMTTLNYVKQNFTV